MAPIKRTSILMTSLALLLGAACGGSEKSVQTPAPDTEDIEQDDEGPSTRRSRVPGMDDDDDDDDGVAIDGLRGHLAPYDIQQGMSGHSGALATCFQSRAKKQKYLGGQVELSFRIATDGTVKTVRASKSSIGSWAVESCLLTESSKMTFREPKGGEAEFSVPLDFEARRTANWWSEEKADEAVGAKASGLSSCAGGDAADPQNVWITLYLGNRGVVESVGFASPHKDGISTAWADCAEAQIRSWTLTDPLGKLAKLGFRYNPE